jgi:N-dimethylarginine dimethylaminohydrolase
MTSLNKNKIVSTKNEYGELRSVLVGSVDHFAWPTDDKEFNESIARSTYEEKMDQGPINSVVKKEASEDLEKLSNTLESNGIEVMRPTSVTPNWAYSARDIILTVGNTVIECPTPFSSRSKELDLYPELKEANCRVVRAPRPQTKNDPMFDAANVLKCNDKLIYSLSHSANEAGAEWLQEQVGTEFEVIKWRAVQHQITHIDSTLLSCGEKTIIANADRLTVDILPDFMKDYKIIWVEDCVPRQFYQFPFASKWIGMNMLSINPETIIVDEIQQNLITQLKQEKFKVIALPMRQSRTLGGGFHCVTCDTHRL